MKIKKTILMSYDELEFLRELTKLTEYVLANEIDRECDVSILKEVHKHLTVMMDVINHGRDVINQAIKTLED